ncbi:MAG: type II toxin-antitoxin system RelE/ParE family toxin [Bryobacteraceae bacterium]
MRRPHREASRRPHRNRAQNASESRLAAQIGRTDELAGRSCRARTVVKGGGGIRKVRVGVGSRGKSGGARVIYYWAVRRDLILLLYAYPKNVTADLTPKQLAQLAKVVKEEFGNEKGDV